MATAQRRPRLALIRQLLEAPQRFEFFQAVRLLENAAAHGGGKHAVGGAIRYSGSHAMHFSGADIAAISALPVGEDHDGALWSMRVNLLTLTGSAGVMPHHYSELLLQRLRARDETLRDFFDLFNQRTIALFFQAWQKYRLPFVYESHRRQQRRGRDPITQALSALVGIGTPQLSERLPLDEEALIGFGGVFGRLVKSAVALENMLRQYLQLDIKIEQFRGQWQELPEDLRSRLPGGGFTGMNNALGINAMLGAHCWQIQSKFRVRIRNLTYAQLMELAPGSARMHNLKTLTQLVAGTELDFDIVLETAREDLPPLQLQDTQQPFQPLLGWNTCMPGLRRRQQRRGHIDVVVSQSV
jgi:type VI secretion system protein ImpH